MILERINLPMMSHQTPDGEGVALENGAVGFIRRFDPIDIEHNTNLVEASIQQCMQGLDRGRLCFRIKKAAGSKIDKKNSRSKAYQALTSVSYEGRVFLDYQNALRLNGDAIPSVHSLFSSELSKLLKFRKLTLPELGDEFYFSESTVTAGGSIIDFGSELVGAVRVYKPSIHLSTLNMASVLALLPVNTEFFTSIRAMEPTRSEIKVRTLRNRQQGMSERGRFQNRTHAADEALVGITQNQERLIDVEQVVIVRATSEKELRGKLGAVNRILSPLGRTVIETDALPETFFATRIGGSSHFAFQDSSRNFGSYLPIYSFQTPQQLQGNPIRGLALTRRDDTLHYFDIFNPKFMAFNGVIVGKTGSGKSVFTNLLTESLLKDASVKVIKIDVGGSYRKECNFVGGEEINFEMDRPCGINPFEIVSKSNSKASLELLSHFVCELLKENEERSVPKEIKAEVEEELTKYLEKSEVPSLNDFFTESKDFRRKIFLKRWTRGGVFEHVFSIQSEKKDVQYRYYNFQNILSAGSKEFSHGVMAAVILEINSEILKAGDRLSNPNGCRIALFCDETKFFIEQNQEFFILTTANFRKYGHGVFLINQSLSNFTIVKNGVKDRSLLINSPIRILFQADYDEEELKAEFGLPSDLIRCIKAEANRGTEFRELVIQDDTGSRHCILRLTTEEYLKASSSAEDNRKIAKLLEAVPGLSLKEAVLCLSRSS